MSDRSRIEWTDATWNPVRGCTKISPGCAHCYAETFAERFRGVPNHPYEFGFDLRLVPTKLAEPGRWRSPKYLAGESYGTTRAAGLAGYLQDRHGMYLNGIMLVSSVLNHLAIRFDDGCILNASMTDYRVPRFDDVPHIDVILLARRDHPPAGAGETPIIAVAPAVANALFAATGERVRSLPLLAAQA